MKIATWNVNSIRAREAQLTSFLEKHNPDVVCLQEIKCEESSFPRQILLDLGYHSAVSGQKTYNGVAILSREKPEEVTIGMNKDVENFDDPQARVIAATISGIRVVSAYVPNGQEPGCEKFNYKLSWLKAFREYLKQCLRKNDLVVAGGDYNIAPEDIDVHDPKKWQNKILCTAEERLQFASLLELGLVDTYRELYPDNQQFSWWDYRAGNFQKNAGLRIDFLLATPELFSLCDDCSISMTERSGEKPSDHAPVIAEFAV
ncbi:MAG: exodeoxyribonuclease III [bacterium]|nr:exodeoxyribonuclease III [bacterium]